MPHALSTAAKIRALKTSTKTMKIYTPRRKYIPLEENIYPSKKIYTPRRKYIPLKENIYPSKKIYTPRRKYIPLEENIYPSKKIYTPRRKYIPLKENIYPSKKIYTPRRFQFLTVTYASTSIKYTPATPKHIQQQSLPSINILLMFTPHLITHGMLTCSDFNVMTLLSRGLSPHSAAPRPSLICLFSQLTALSTN